MTVARASHQLRSQPAVQTDNVMNLPSLVSALLEAAETASCLRTRARTGESLLWALSPIGLCTAGARSRSGAVIPALRRGGRTAMSNASVLRGGSAKEVRDTWADLGNGPPAVEVIGSEST